MREIGIWLFFMLAAFFVFPEDIGKSPARIQKGFLEEMFAEPPTE